MTENEIATIVVDTCYHVHREMGSGLLESVYEEVLYYELSEKRIKVCRQKPISVFWKGIKP